MAKKKALSPAREDESAMWRRYDKILKKLLAEKRQGR